MTDPLTIKLKTLTPLWTGGADGKSDRLHITGIIGSLRWWYEALVRGLGGSACDPSEYACNFKKDVYQKNKDKSERERLLATGLCDVCQVFGATGWRRKFRLIVREDTHSEGPRGSQKTSGQRFKSNGHQKPTWYFNNGPGRAGEITLDIISLKPDFDTQLIVGLLKMIEHHAALAARTQLGYGWVRIEDIKHQGEFWSFDADQFVQLLPQGAQQGIALPNVFEMFFAEVDTDDSDITATLNLKYDLRAAFRQAFGNNQQLRHSICGVVRGQHRRASKINFSQAVDEKVRIWGWIPEKLPIQDITRIQVADEIYQTISRYGAIKKWREFNSPRDTVMKSQGNKLAFLKSLYSGDSNAL